MHRFPDGAPQDGVAIPALSPGEEEEEEEEARLGGGREGARKKRMGILVEVHCRVRMRARVRERKRARHVTSNGFLKGNTTRESAEVDGRLIPATIMINALPFITERTAS